MQAAGSAPQLDVQLGAAASVETPLVLRRDLPVQPLAGPGALPAWAAGRAAETLGPFTGALGQSVFVDIFGRAKLSSVRRAGSASPFLVVAGRAPRWSGRGRGTLGAGSIWISARQLAADAPAGSWVGLTISGGSITGVAPTPGPGGVLVVPDGATLTLEVKLAPPKPTAGKGPGQDARDADVRVPPKVVLDLAPAGGVVKQLDEGLLGAYGTTVRLRYENATPSYVRTLGSVVVPMDLDAAEWNPAEAASTLAQLGGGGPIQAGGWALPVTVAQPSTLGQAAGCGGLALLVSDLTLDFAAQARPMPAGAAWLLANPGLLTLAADAALGAGLGGQVTLYPDPQGGATVGGRATFRFADAFALRYLVSGAGTETIAAWAALDVSLDRPVTASGSRIPLTSERGVFSLVQDSTRTRLGLEGTSDGSSAGELSVALDNALLRVGAAGLFFVGGTVTSDAPSLEMFVGTAVILLLLRDALPTLPDPYAATVAPVPRRRDFTHVARVDETASFRTTAAQVLRARLEWDATGGPAAPTLAFNLASTAAPFARGAEPASAPAETGAAGFASMEVFRASKDAELLSGLRAAAVRAAGSVPGPIALLDVSSAADQFGVRYGIGRPSQELARSASPTASTPTIEGFSVVAPAYTIRVITLPAVQWEPVNGPDATGPFSPMSFPDSGGETELVSKSVRLVPVEPKPAIAEMVHEFHTRPAAGVVAWVTFPFGIRAVAMLDPSVGALGAGLDLHRPHFDTPNLSGGRQLRATAPPNLGQGGRRSRSFRGASIQLSNGLHNGVPTGLSPIDPLTDIFNTEFGPTGVDPQVPVERFELSGYGESVFSNWKDDTDTVPAVSQVRFDVLVGRTSVEIVQARSILYPYAVRVIRTIKMLRDNAGRVQRTDSGWKAVTDGRYAWPRPELRTHPGVVLGVTDVANIRDTGQRWTSSGGTELMAVRFDCLVDLDGAVTSVGGAPSHEQLGFVQISVNPQPGMAPAELAELIATFGPLGGVVDAVVAVGGSGQRSRVGHVGVGVTAGTTGPEFVMAAWGSPVLPKGGPWSVVRRRTGDPAPVPVDQNLGVPLIRAGYAGSAPSSGSPYRFADPEDLATPDAPGVDYALMHSTNTQRVLFPRPKVELTGARADELSSTQAPLLADPFLLTTAVGLFPPLASAIQFPDADYGLRTVGGTDLVLDLAHNDFDVTGGDRTIHAAGGNTFFVRYRDEDGNPATVHLEVDSTRPVPWAFSVGGIELCLTTSLMGEVIRFLGTVEASAARAGRFTGGTIHFGSALSAIQVFTDFLGQNRLADLPLGSRNQPSLEIALKIPIVGGPGEPEDIDVGIGTLADADVTVGVKIDLTSGATSLKFELDGIITGRTPYPPLVAAGQVKFEIESDASGNVFKFTLGFGVGVQADVGPFKAEAYFFQNDYFVVGTAEIGFGIGVEFKASIDLGIVSAEVDVEAAALMIQTSCGPPAATTLWLVAQLTIGVDITICWVIDINFEYQMQMQTNVDGGPCQAPMV